MKNTVINLKPREKSAILRIITEGIENGLSKKETIKQAEKKMVSLKLVENEGVYNEMLAVCLAFYEMENARINGTDITEYIVKYCHFKMVTYYKLSDYGAFGDMVETLTRVASKPRNFVKYSDIHVKRQGETDITVKGVKIEVGINVKTLLESTEQNAMNGKYKKVFYGVFDDMEMQTLFNLCADIATIEKGIENILKMLYVFSKDEFFSFMTEKTGRGSMFQYKPTADKWQVIYNTSKHKAFKNASQHSQ